MERKRTIEWQDPMPGARQAQQMSGMEYLQAIGDGQIPYPPILHTMDLKVAYLEKGKVIFSFQPQEFHYNPIGTVHGGVISTILDSAMGCTVHTMLPAGTAYTTVELKINFLKAATIATGELQAIGKIISIGSRIALVEAQLVDKDHTIFAHGISTCLIMKL